MRIPNKQFHLGESPATSIYPKDSAVRLSLICRDKGRAELVPGGPTALAWKGEGWHGQVEDVRVLDWLTTTTTTTTPKHHQNIHNHSFCMTGWDIENVCACVLLHVWKIWYSQPLGIMQLPSILLRTGLSGAECGLVWNVSLVSIWSRVFLYIPISSAVEKPLFSTLMYSPNDELSCKGFDNVRKAESVDPRFLVDSSC